MQHQTKQKSSCFVAATYVGLFAMLAALATGCSADNHGRQGEKIDLCEFSGPNFREIESRLHREVIPGDHASRLITRIAWNASHVATDEDVAEVAKRENLSRHLTTFREAFPENKRNNPALQFYLDGFVIVHHQICGKPHRNSDHWFLFIHADHSRRISEFGLVLAYVDRNFAARNEPLNHRRYLVATAPSLTSSGHRKPVAMALDSLWIERDYSAEHLMDEIREAGFVRNWSKRMSIHLDAAPERQALVHEFTFPDPLDITVAKTEGELVYYRAGGVLNPDFDWRFYISESLDSGAILKVE